MVEFLIDYFHILNYAYLVQIWTQEHVFVDEMMLDEETLNVDLPTIPLITILNSTNNFSKASKLGEGGFGPVYKVLMIWNLL